MVQLSHQQTYIQGTVDGRNHLIPQNIGTSMKPNFALMFVHIGLHIVTMQIKTTKVGLTLETPN